MASVTSAQTPGGKMIFLLYYSFRNAANRSKAPAYRLDVSRG